MFEVEPVCFTVVRPTDKLLAQYYVRQSYSLPSSQCRRSKQDGGGLAKSDREGVHLCAGLRIECSSVLRLFGAYSQS